MSAARDPCPSLSAIHVPPRRLVQTSVSSRVGGRDRGLCLQLGMQYEDQYSKPEVDYSKLDLDLAGGREDEGRVQQGLVSSPVRQPADQRSTLRAQMPIGIGRKQMMHGQGAPLLLCMGSRRALRRVRRATRLPRVGEAVALTLADPGHTAPRSRFGLNRALLRPRPQSMRACGASGGCWRQQSGAIPSARPPALFVGSVTGSTGAVS
jgi:hypothetical protein